MSDARAEALDLLTQAHALPNTRREKVDLLEAAARHADSAEDRALAFSIRDELVDSALDAGEVSRALVAFGWCLAQCDEDPTQFPESRLHWRYKWVLEWAPRFAEISREQIGRLLDDVDARFARRGIGRNAMSKLRARAAMFLGEDADLERWYGEWKRTKRDALSDCRACDVDEDVMILFHLGKANEGLAVFESMLQQRLGCAEVPHVTLARVLPPLLREGRIADADRHHRRGYPMLKRLERKLVGHVGEHLLYTAVVGDIGRGLRILRETLALAAEHPVTVTQMAFSLGAHLLLDRAGRSDVSSGPPSGPSGPPSGDGVAITLSLPIVFGGDGVKRKYQAAEVATTFEQRARDLAKRLDERNGNDRMSRLRDEWLAFRDLDLAGEYTKLRQAAKPAT